MGSGADDRREQPLYWPEDMLGLLLAHATRTDHRLSYIAQLARSAIEAMAPAQR